jgi:predicted porin
MNITKMNQIGVAVAALVVSCSAFADRDFKFGTCTATIGGQFQAGVSNVTGGNDVTVNIDEDRTLYFLDLKTGLGCKVAANWDVEGFVRMRPLKGNTFDIQGHHIGSREAWLGVANPSLGSLRYGRFINRMVDETDDYGAPSLYAEASTYNATGGDMTRSMSMRYTSPQLKGFQGEVTFGGAPRDRDLELYGRYDLGSWNFQTVYSRSVMTGAYERVATTTIGNRNLVNSGLFAGVGYEFGNGAKIKVGAKTNQFALPSDSNGVYSPGGSIKTVTTVNTLALSGSYPLNSSFTLSGSALRFLDTKTRGVTANDGATLLSLSLKYAFNNDASVSLGYKNMRLDRAGAIPGSGYGVNQAMPDATVSGKAISDKRWVFSQSYANNNFASPLVHSIGMTFEYNF